jgi:hypothetical protein
MKRGLAVPIALGLVIVFIIVGFFIPVDSFTTNYACRPGAFPPRVERLHLIRGQTLQKVKNPGNYSAVGCAREETKYLLYIF